MRFGLFSVVDHYPNELERSTAVLYAELLEQARLADQLGFYSYWIAEHHFHEYGAIPRPAVFLSAVAAITRQIKLGSAVAVLPFDNPLRVAEDFAMVDILSGGRLEFGVGSGYLEHEYAGFDLDPQERRARFDESLDIIRKCWTGDKFSFAGNHFKINAVRLNVVPLQSPSPPIFIAVLRNEAAVFVGRQKMGMMMIPYASTEELAELSTTCAAYKDEHSRSGGESQNARIQFGLHCFCASSTEQARELARPYMDRYVRTRLYARQRPFDELIEKNLLAIGDPKEIIRVGRLYEQAGLTDFLMIMNFGGLPHDSVLESMRLIASEVLPAFAESKSSAGCTN